MNKLFKFLFLFFIGIPSFAQKNKVYNSGKKVVRVPLAYVHDAISVNSSDFLVVSYQVRGVYKRLSAALDETSITLKNNSRLNIYKFDDDLNLIQKKSFERNIYGKRVWFEKLLKFGDDVWLFYSYSNVQTQKNYLFVQKFDPHNLELENEPVKVAEMLYKGKRWNYGYYNFSFSPDGNFLMIAGVPVSTPAKLFKSKKENAKNDATLTAWVLNNKMEIVNYAKKVKLSASSKKLSIVDYIVGNDGSITFLGGENPNSKTGKKKAKKKGEVKLENVKFVVTHYDSTGDISEYNFNSKDIRILDIKMAYNSVSGNLNALCLYSEKLKGAKGVLNMELSSDDLSEISFNKMEFSDEFIYDANAKKTTGGRSSKKSKVTADKPAPKSKYLAKKDSDDGGSKDSKGSKYKTDAEINNLTKVVSVNFDNTGNPIGIFEKQWLEIIVTRSTDSKGNSTTTTTYYYYYDDAVICKIADGAIASPQIIRKQTTLINYYKPKGLDCLENDDNLLVLYGDKTVEFDKEDLKPDKKSGLSKKETRYKMYGLRKQLAPNKILVFYPKSKHKLELQYYRYN